MVIACENLENLLASENHVHAQERTVSTSLWRKPAERHLEQDEKEQEKDTALEEKAVIQFGAFVVILKIDTTR